MITSIDDLKKCGSDSCLYKLCLRVNCQYSIDKINYCGNYVKATKSLDDTEVSDNDRFERIFKK